jgi:hypothetical protein
MTPCGATKATNPTIDETVVSCIKHVSYWRSPCIGHAVPRLRTQCAPTCTHVRVIPTGKKAHDDRMLYVSQQDPTWLVEMSDHLAGAQSACPYPLWGRRSMCGLVPSLAGEGTLLPHAWARLCSIHIQTTRRQNSTHIRTSRSISVTAQRALSGEPEMCCSECRGQGGCGIEAFLAKG